MPSGHSAADILDPQGIAPTFTENHGTVNAIKEERYYGIYDIKESDTFRPTQESRIHKNSDVSRTITTREDSCGVMLKGQTDYARERERER